TYAGVILTVSDGTTTATETIAIAIGNTNRAPVLAPIGNKSGSEGSLLTFTVAATDADGDALTYSAGGLPAGATFDAATKTFSWTPSFTQAGTSPGVTFTVTDGTAPISETIAITIANTNRAPTAVNGTLTTPEDAPTSGTFVAADADEDALTYTVVTNGTKG